jgi:hypothetical protein
MKRKFFLNSEGALLSGIALAFLLSATQSQAAVGDVFTDNNFKYTVLSEKGAVGTVSVGQRTDVSLPGVLIIPGSVYHSSVTYAVTDIAEGGFYNCTGLGSVTIPMGVTILGDGAFSDCTGMTEISIPEGVTRFGEEVFANCYNLASITIPDSVIEMGDYPFYDCRNLTEIVVGNNNPIFSSLDGVLFNKDRTTLLQCPGGKDGVYTVPNSVTSIGDYAFEECGWLTKVVIPDSVTNIGVDVFYGCFILKEIVVGNNNPNFSSLDGVLFNKDRTMLLLCPEGKNGEYTIPNGVITISDYAFSNCEFLTSMVIGDSVTEIGSNAFYLCSGLTSVVIGNGVTVIGDNAFSNCTSLMNLAIGNSVTDIGNYAFTICYSLKSVTIPNGVISIGNFAFSLCYDLEKITIPDSVTSLGEGAFRYCSNLSDISIPDELTNIGIDAFYECNQLPLILFSIGGKTLVRYSESNMAAEYSIPTSVDYIANAAFAYNEYLEKVTIPENVTYVGRYAFLYCAALADISIPDILTDFGADAFYGCDQLPPILFSDGGKTLVRYLETITATEYSVPAGVTSIADVAFAFCENLVSVTIPESVTSIGDYAFWDCYGLTNISLPDTITRFGINAFYGCDKLPPVLFSVGGKILFVYSYLNTEPDYSIPEGVVTIADGAFAYCDYLVNLTLPESLTRIENYAFWYCPGMAEITFPESVTSLGSWAFYGCSSLTSAYFKGDAPELGEEVFDSDPILYYSAGTSGWTTPTWNGYRTAIWGPVEPPTLSSEVKEGKLILTYSGGSLQSSSDLILWSPVEGALEGKYEVDLPKTGKLFYRIAQ